MNILILILFAQEANGTISGTVRDGGTGEPLSRVEVTSGKFSATTDSRGAYTLADVPPGTRMIHAGNVAPVAKFHATRTVTLASGEKLESVDLTVTRKGSITGRVVDDDGEPLPRIEVVVFTREYVDGQARLFRKSNAYTDDRGVYDLPFLSPGISYLLMAKPVDTFKNAVKQKFIEPKLRAPVLVPTYYPSSTSPEGNPLITLAPDDRRENIDFRMVRSASYCATGQFTASGQTAQLTYELHETDWSFGIGPNGGRTSIPHGDKSTPDGKVRICGLHRGDYALTAFAGDPNKRILVGNATITILDRDLQNFALNAVAPVSIPGEVRWVDAAPEHPLTAELTVLLQSNTRSFNAFLNAGSAVPGKFTFSSIPIGEYRLEPRSLPGTFYVKDITYACASLLRSSLVVNQPSQQTISILIGHDGAYLNVSVNDREGRRIPDATVILIPADLNSESELASRRIIGRTDQTGTYQSPALAPIRYYLVATAATPNLTVEGIGAIWGARFKGQDVSLKAGSKIDISLEPMPLN